MQLQRRQHSEELDALNPLEVLGSACAVLGNSLGVLVAGYCSDLKWGDCWPVRTSWMWRWSEKGNIRIP